MIFQATFTSLIVTLMMHATSLTYCEKIEPRQFLCRENVVWLFTYASSRRKKEWRRNLYHLCPYDSTQRESSFSGRPNIALVLPVTLVGSASSSPSPAQTSGALASQPVDDSILLFVQQKQWWSKIRRDTSDCRLKMNRMDGSLGRGPPTERSSIPSFALFNKRPAAQTGRGLNEHE